MISPTDDLPHGSIDSVKMRNPKIFEVSSEVSKKTTGVQTDETFGMNGDLQSISKPVRITQLVPITVMPKGRLKRPVRSIRSRTDSI
ncbi:hypothetical protein LOAG_09564 [Loa loa]|nr:hypothetical protein LOAG_09564 [Loa loa]EFO18937.1 hypothetical protein LOAG_09564 [Loa loa]